MSYLKLEKSKLDALIAQETKLRDDSPEYTLDWYTYDNRVKLLEEVQAATTVIKEEKKMKAAKVAEVKETPSKDTESKDSK